MKAYVFPGQGAQFSGMGKDLYESSAEAKDLFEKANEILGFRISDIMFEGTEEELKQTKVTQPAIFLHSVILAKTTSDFKPDMVAGHSLGEFSALVANGTLAFEDGLKLVYQRALAMQEACEINGQVQTLWGQAYPSREKNTAKKRHRNKDKGNDEVAFFHLRNAHVR